MSAELATIQAVAYAAGFIDGEGCLSTWRRRTGRPILYPALYITNSEREPLEYIQRHFGGMLTSQAAPRSSRTIYKLSYMSATALWPILTEVRPYLIVKAAQCDLLMDFLELMGQDSTRRVPDGNIDARERIAGRLRELKAA